MLDHCDPDEPDSIVGVMKRCGPSKTYDLVTNAGVRPYSCGHPIEVPRNSTLLSGNSATVVASADLSYLVNLRNNGAEIQELSLDGAFRANHVVWASRHPTDANKACEKIGVRYSTVQRSRKASKAHLIHFSNCTDFTVTGSVLRWAGMDSGERFSHGASLISIQSGNQQDPSKSGRITWNDLAYALSSGIRMTDSVNMLVSHNRIEFTGQSSVARADGITGYHSSAKTIGQDKHWTIEHNTIVDSDNHGIHVAGRGIVIRYNTLLRSRLHHIYLGDWRAIGGGMECSVDSEIHHNTMDAPASKTHHAISLGPYDDATVAVYGNTCAGASCDTEIREPTPWCDEVCSANDPDQRCQGRNSPGEGAECALDSDCDTAEGYACTPTSTGMRCRVDGH